MLQMQTYTSGIPWEFRFDIASDEMAIEYAFKIVKNAGLPASCRSVILWKLNPEKLLKEFTLETETKIKEY
jgi:hypothetical protein